MDVEYYYPKATGRKIRGTLWRTAVEGRKAEVERYVTPPEGKGRHKFLSTGTRIAL
jgi:hypothetical protein